MSEQNRMTIDLGNWTSNDGGMVSATLVLDISRLGNCVRKACDNKAKQVVALNGAVKITVSEERGP